MRDLRVSERFRGLTCARNPDLARQPSLAVIDELLRTGLARQAVKGTCWAVVNRRL